MSKMPPEERMAQCVEKTRRLRLKKLAHHIKGLPGNQKKECLDLLNSYAEWYDYAVSVPADTDEHGYAVWERNYYHRQLEFVLHYGLTGDVFSRAGATILAFSPEKRAYLEKRNKELVELDKLIEAYGESSEEERQRFHEELKPAFLSRLVSKKQVADQSFGQRTSERSFMKD